MMTDFEKAVTIFAEIASESAGFDGGVPVSTILDAEHRLGLTFPADLKAFYTQFGGGGVGGIDIAGLAFPEGNVVGVTLEGREGGLHEKLLVLESTGDGGFYTLDLRSDDEQPVRVWAPGASDSVDDLEPVAENFGEFLLMRAETAKQVVAYEP
ncbi:SMI1/KNR4 family protein [Rhizobium sp. MHM7A]|uniref:SMI1/KNR4 family protein n=1 Tax=Rhizobium sp. MHM7A TaxID=2583233 RepID=UPI001106E48D|nr:SMI1/KNR4 family protein [Rhizobium sp. MHM7A]TLX17156.1 SMI1/KNR4 family protein [Rhizobium sp. MHM7A]